MKHFRGHKLTSPYNWERHSLGGRLLNKKIPAARANRDYYKNLSIYGRALQAIMPVLLFRLLLPPRLM